MNNPAAPRTPAVPFAAAGSEHVLPARPRTRPEAREADVLARAVSSASARNIAGAPGIAFATVRAHLRGAYSKLGV